ncbi:MAG: hypothetical protein NT097_02900 [Actinobacteria bacterium]|nr:hypothetical protein [Actinomycetota bacterium]
MYSRLNRIRKREIQTDPVEAFQPKTRIDKSKKWSIRIPVPSGPAGEHWGDLYFARDLALSISNLGNEVEIQKRNLLWLNDGDEDVSLVIRGLERVNPKPGCINVLWIISTPELITKDELESFDLVFAASNVWAEQKTNDTGVEIRPLLQCTDPKRFNPNVSSPDTAPGIIFVGNARSKLRKVIADSKKARIQPRIYGKGWERLVDPSWIAGTFVSNEELPGVYRSSTFVLNDHRPDMAKRGFLSNRLFDAAAAGARVVSDDVDGIHEVFNGAVQVYASPEELRALCSESGLALFGDDKTIENRALQIGAENSFEARARELVRAVNELMSN